MNLARFARGSGCFACEVCGRQTRDTGVQSVGSRQCPDCYEIAGIYNVLQDGGDVAEYADDIRRHTENITAKGGTLDSDAHELLAEIGQAVQP